MFQKGYVGLFWKTSISNRSLGSSTYTEERLECRMVSSLCQSYYFFVCDSFIATFRSSHQKCSVRKDVLRNFTNFTAKHLCQSLFVNKAAGLTPATLLKKRLWHRCFSMNFVTFLRTRFLQNASERLLLNIVHLKLQFMQTSLFIYCIFLKVSQIF